MKNSLRKTTNTNAAAQNAAVRLNRVSISAEKYPEELQSVALPPRARTLRYVGSVTRSTSERILREMGKLVDDVPDEAIALFVTSPGGQTGVAMSFYDTVRHVLKPALVTIGSGDVDSSGIIIFLAGTRRYVTNRTTLLLHPAGRIFGNQRFTTKEMEAMLAEDRIKDQQYASLIAQNSNGKLLMEEVLYLMERYTILTPQKLLELGLADGILP